MCKEAGKNVKARKVSERFGKVRKETKSGTQYIKTGFLRIYWECQGLSTRRYGITDFLQCDLYKSHQ